MKYGVPENVFEAIHHQLGEFNFEPVRDTTPTEACPGSIDKVEVLKKRIQNGEPLWHEQDKYDYEGVEHSKVRVQQTGKIKRKKWTWKNKEK